MLISGHIVAGISMTEVNLTAFFMLVSTHDYKDTYTPLSCYSSLHSFPILPSLFHPFHFSSPSLNSLPPLPTLPPCMLCQVSVKERFIIPESKVPSLMAGAFDLNGEVKRLRDKGYDTHRATHIHNCMHHAHYTPCKLHHTHQNTQHATRTSHRITHTVAHSP